MEEIFNHKEIFDRDAILKIAKSHGVKSVNYITTPKQIIEGKFYETFTYMDLNDLFKLGGDIYLLEYNVNRGFNINKEK